ncbi:MAG: dephospho-CoA kinase [Parcubacteria group bacterium]
MIVVGLTGSIGMGKSTTAAMFRDEGVPVYDADAAVHEIYAPGGAAVAPIEAAFPGTTGPNGVDRAKLSARVVGHPEELKRLESIVHPLIAESRARFFADAQAKGADIVVLDIPLLFETGGEKAMNAVVVVSAPAEVQRSRVLGREGMDEAKLDAILARQMKNEEKCARAHFVVDTGQGLDHARAQVRDILATLRREGVPALAADSKASH